MKLKRSNFLPALLSGLVFAGAGAIILWKFLMPGIPFITLFIFLFFYTSLFSLGLFFIKKTTLRKKWEELREKISLLEIPDPDKNGKVQVKKLTNEPTEILEYLLEWVDRIQFQFKANKQFTTTAAHELQTPLMLIKANAELLIQSASMKSIEMEALGHIMNAVNRLSKINTALILLSRIEHGRFTDDAKVNFAQVLEEELKNFRDLIKMRKIEIKKHISAPFKKKMSRTLAEILLANLLQNAIRHNLAENGFILAEMNEQGLKLTNSGKELKDPAELMFQRFHRESDKEGSLGLGLSIVKRIADYYHMEIHYLHENGTHELWLKDSVKKIMAD